MGLWLACGGLCFCPAGGHWSFCGAHTFYHSIPSCRCMVCLHSSASCTRLTTRFTVILYFKAEDYVYRENSKLPLDETRSGKPLAGSYKTFLSYCSRRGRQSYSENKLGLGFASPLFVLGKHHITGG